MTFPPRSAVLLFMPHLVLHARSTRILSNGANRKRRRKRRARSSPFAHQSRRAVGTNQCYCMLANGKSARQRASCSSSGQEALGHGSNATYMGRTSPIDGIEKAQHSYKTVITGTFTQPARRTSLALLRLSNKSPSVQRFVFVQLT